jgi:DNA (cytosine-5)-methyltransferase 1
MITLNLCAGAGGLAKGLQMAGCRSLEMFELNREACQTLRANCESESPTLTGNVHQEDVRTFDWSSISSPVSLLASAVPCQPFSLGGKHKAYEDDRNGFPALFRAIRMLNPAIVLVENVRGLLRADFQAYFEYILRQLEAPSVTRGKSEDWQAHDAKIRQRQCRTDYSPEYRVMWRLLNAADYGVPQTRFRVFIVATKIHLPIYTFPPRTHGSASLLSSQASGAYWREHEISARPVFHRNGIKPDPDQLKRWRTVRDAIHGLSDAASEEGLAEINHWTIPGARVYAGHTGSHMDWPAKAIKAGVHGVPGGENTVVDDTGVTRYLTLREAARIQTFPDEHVFLGARLHVTRQIGNAVPCELAAAVARPLFQLLEACSR